MGQIKVEKNVGGIAGLCVIEPAVHGTATTKPNWDKDVMPPNK